MANIVLKDKNGANIAYKNVDYVSFQTLEGGTVRFNEGDIRVIPVEELPTEDIKEEVLYKIETIEGENIKIVFYMYENGEWAEYAVGGGLVDVTELPAEGVEQNKIYRIVGEEKDVCEIYITMDQEDIDDGHNYGLTNPINFAVWSELDNGGPTVTNIYVVDLLPEVGEVSSYDEVNNITTQHYYIVANDSTSVYYYYYYDDNDCGWDTLADSRWWGECKGVVTDLSQIDNNPDYSCCYILKKHTSSHNTYGIPNEFNSVYKYSTEIGWENVDTVIDVAELPIENVRQDKIYKVTGEASAEIYLKFPGGPIMTLAEFFQSVPDEFPPIDNCITHLIESPGNFNFDTIIPYSSSGPDLHVYVNTESGSAFVNLDDGNGICDIMWNTIGFPSDGYKGIISSINDLENYEYGFGYVIVPPLSGYGIPDESNDKDIFKYSSEIGWEKLGATGERKETIEVYVTDGNERCLTFAEYMQILQSNALSHPCPLPHITYEIVDEIPAFSDVAYEDRMNVLQGDEEGKEWGFKCFILRTTGEPYFAYHIEFFYDGCESVSLVSQHIYGVTNISYKGFISDPAEIELNTNMEIFTLLKVVESSNAVIDVDKLPVTNISNDKVYRIVQRVPEIWVALIPWVAEQEIGCSNPINLVDMLKKSEANANFDCVVNVYLVDQLPSVGEPECVRDYDAKIAVYNYYIFAGYPDNPVYVYFNDRWTHSSLCGNYKGTITSLSQINVDGNNTYYYLLKNGTETHMTYGISSDCCIQVYKDGAWTTIWGEPIPEIPDKEVEDEEVERE